MKRAARRLSQIERAVALAGDQALAIVLAAGRPPAAIEREVAELDRRLGAAGRHGQRVIVMDR